MKTNSHIIRSVIHALFSSSTNILPMKHMYGRDCMMMWSAGTQKGTAVPMAADHLVGVSIRQTGHPHPYVLLPPQTDVLLRLTWLRRRRNEVRGCVGYAQLAWLEAGCAFDTSHIKRTWNFHKLMPDVADSLGNWLVSTNLLVGKPLVFKSGKV